MDKSLKEALYLGIVLIVLFIGFFTGYLVFSKDNLRQNPVTGSATQNYVFEKLSPEGLKVAEGLVSPCGSREALAVHNCYIANDLRARINKLLNSGMSVKEVRELLIKLYGEKILARSGS